MYGFLIFGNLIEQLIAFATSVCENKDEWSPSNFEAINSV